MGYFLERGECLGFWFLPAIFCVQVLIISKYIEKKGMYLEKQNPSPYSRGETITTRNREGGEK